MARRSTRGKFQAYAEAVGTDMGEFFNRNIRETLKVGVHALVANTQQDSGRAANHWVVIPDKGSVNPGSWKEMTFNPVYGVPPVGRIGDRRSETGQTELVIKAVVNREFSRTIQKVVAGRDPATKFQFQNNIPGAYNDRTGERSPSGSGNYRVNANLKQAKEAAESVMRAKFDRLVAAGNVRKNRL